MENSKFLSVSDNSFIVSAEISYSNNAVNKYDIILAQSEKECYNRTKSESEALCPGQRAVKRKRTDVRVGHQATLDDML